MGKYRLSVAFVTAIVATVGLNTAFAAQRGFTIDMSAQEQVNKPVKPAPKAQPRPVQPRQVQPRQIQPRQVQPRQVQPRQVQPQIQQQRAIQPRSLQGPSAVQQKQLNRGQFTQQPRIQRSTTQRQLGQPRQFGHVTIRNANRVSVAGGNYSVWRQGYRVHRNGYWRTFVGLGALSAVMFGTAYYYPYAFVDAPAPYCDGLTEDGCQLEWQAVPTVEGPTEFACVAYCPWQ